MTKPKDLGPADRFAEAIETDRQRQLRRWREANVPELELISPGLLIVLEAIEQRHPRRVAKLRRLLRWAYRVAKQDGILP